jgi:hypothetical protein
MAVSEPVALVSFLAPYPRPVRELFLAGRSLLLDRLAPVVELHYDATSAVCAGFAYTGDLKGAFVNLAAYADHVTLVFAWGAKLSDAEHRLKGEGKQVRHMRLADLEALRDPYVLDLVRQASDAAPRPAGEVRHAIVVKVYEGPKRRPQPAGAAPVRRPKTKTRPKR